MIEHSPRPARSSGGPGLVRQKASPGLDGRVYPAEVETELNLLAARVLGSADGVRFMNYLRGITLNAAFTADVSPTALMHMEGQRWLVGMLMQRIAAGRN